MALYAYVTAWWDKEEVSRRFMEKLKEAEGEE